MNQKTYSIIILSIISIFGFSLLYKLGEVPAGLFCDEASRGIEAAIMLETGADSMGRIAPAFIKTFGNAIGGLIFYSNIIPLVFSDLSVFTVRITIVFWSLIGVIFFAKLSRQMFSPIVSICSVLFLISSFWFWQNSRIGFEFISLPALLMGSLAYGIHPQKSQFSAVISMALLALTFYTYLPSFIVSPCLFIFMISYWKFSERLETREILIGVAAFLIFAAPAIYNSIWGEVFTRWAQVDDDAQFGVEYILSLINRYFGHFSLRFLVIQGDLFGRNYVEGFGIISKYLLPLLFFGLIKIFSNIIKRRDLSRSALIAFLLFVIYPLPGMLTADGASFTRSISGVIGISLAAAIGLEFIFTLGKRVGVTLALLIILLVGIDVRDFIKAYFTVFATTSAQKGDGWQYGVKEIIEETLPYARKGYRIFITSNDFNQLGALLDFYLFKDPLRNNFEVCNYDCYNFETPIIAVIRPSSYFPFLGEDRGKIYYPSGEIAFHIVELKQNLPKDWKWKISQILPRNVEFQSPSDISKITEFTKEEFFNNPFGVNLLGKASSCVVAESILESENDRIEKFYGIADDTLTLWVNDQIAIDIPTFNDFRVVSGEAQIKKGINKVFVKHCNDSDASFFSIYFDTEVLHSTK